MKSRFRYIIIVVIISILVPFVACSDEMTGYTMNDGVLIPDSPVAVAIILGRHANAMAIPKDAYEAIEDITQHAVYGGYVCVIISDSYPTKSEDFLDSDFFEADRRGKAALQKEIEKRKEIVSDRLRDETLKADHPENDLLAAIREAKSALNAPQARDIKDKRIVIVDTGVCTAGELSFLDSRYSTTNLPDIDETVRNLKKSGLLPDLAGINVTFIGTDNGMAKVASPQMLSTTDEQYIKRLWDSVAKASGASAVNHAVASGWLTPNVHTEDSESKFFAVTPAIISDEAARASMWSNSPYDPNLPTIDLELQLLDQAVGFIPNQAEFRDESQANRILKTCADEVKKHLNSNPGQKIWLVGTTADPQRNGVGDVYLGSRRAQKVASALTADYGIPADTFVVIGVGANFPWHKDEFKNGKFDTVVAQENRSVWVLSNSDSNEKYSDLINAYNSGELLPDAIAAIDRVLS